MHFIYSTLKEITFDCDLAALAWLQPRRRRDVDGIRRTLEEGADVESRDGHQGTPLHRPAVVGRDEAVNGVLAKKRIDDVDSVSYDRKNF